MPGKDYKRSNFLQDFTRISDLFKFCLAASDTIIKNNQCGEFFCNNDDSFVEYFSLVKQR